jgi:glycerol-3-phosphate acyltransferase PlsX
LLWEGSTKSEILLFCSQTLSLALKFSKTKYIVKKTKQLGGKMKIVLDIYGADKGPEVLMQGAYDAMREMPDLQMVFSGKQAEIEALIAKIGIDKNRCEIIDAPDIVTGNDSPTSILRTKKNSSLVAAGEYIVSDGDAMITAGSTGAALSLATLKIGRIKGILRPALAPVLPTYAGKEVCLVDCGASVDCKSEYLVQFAHMGVLQMQTAFGVQNPRVAIVSVGDEDKKGNELTKEVFARLKESKLNFVGNMEARYALTDQYDVLVCDGFVGNVLLKSTEGTASLVMNKLKEALMSSFSSKLAALMMKKQLRSLKNEMDYHKKGGAPLLGVQKVFIKCHGSSNATSIKAGIFQAVRMVKGNLIAKLEEVGAMQQ